jgi:hypothetical protein
MRRQLLSILFALLLAGGAIPAAAQHLFATDTNHPSPALRRFTNAGGSVLTLPLGAGTLPEGVAFDDVGKQVYWVEASHSGARIRRTSLDLGPGTTLLSGLGSLRGICVDAAGGHLYWTASDQASGAFISRADLDGSNVQVLFVLPNFNPRQIALDAVNGWVYWTELEQNGIARCRLNGADGQWAMFLPPGSRPYGIAVREATQELYWTEYGTGTVQKLPLPPGAAASTARAGGTAEASGAQPFARRPTGDTPSATEGLPPTLVLGGLARPTHLTLDESAGLMFVSQAGVGVQSIRRANLDGSGLVTLPVTQAAFGGIVAVGTALLDVPEPPEEPRAGVPLSLAARNPARGSAEIAFGLPASGPVRLRIYDAAGREVAIVAEGEHDAGPHRVTWTGQTTTGRAAPGMYVARLEAAGKTLTRRFAYVR